jgi:hypothetical protein
VVSLYHLQYLVLGVVGGAGAHTLGESRCGQARLDSQTQLQGLDGAALVPTRFVEPTPEGHRPQERAHDMRMFAAAAIKTAIERHPGRGIVVGVRFESGERPRHGPSSHLAKQVAELAFKDHGGFGRRRCVDKPVKELTITHNFCELVGTTHEADSR